MNNRPVMLVAIIVVSIFIGVTITVQQTNGPLMRRLVSQQAEILDLQRRILNTASVSGTPQAGGATVEQRLARVEGQLVQLMQLISRLQPQAQPQPQRPQVPSDEYTKVHEIPLAHSPVRGRKDAAVSIVVFGDFQCPYSARFQPTLKDVIAAYPDEVNYVLKHFPLGFHPQARLASKATFAAGEQGKYWEMVDILLDNFRSLSPDKINEMAQQIGLDVEKFKQDLEAKDAQYEEHIKEDMALGQKVGVRGTPTFYINGRKTNAREMAAYKQEIDKILSDQK